MEYGDEFDVESCKYVDRMILSFTTITLIFLWLGLHFIAMVYFFGTIVMIVGPEEENGEGDLEFGSYEWNEDEEIEHFEEMTFKAGDRREQVMNSRDDYDALWAEVEGGEIIDPLEYYEEYILFHNLLDILDSSMQPAGIAEEEKDLDIEMDIKNTIKYLLKLTDSDITYDQFVKLTENVVDQITLNTEEPVRIETQHLLEKRFYIEVELRNARRADPRWYEKNNEYAILQKQDYRRDLEILQNTWLSSGIYEVTDSEYSLFQDVMYKRWHNDQGSIKNPGIFVYFDETMWRDNKDYMIDNFNNGDWTHYIEAMIKLQSGLDNSYKIICGLEDDNDITIPDDNYIDYKSPYYRRMYGIKNWWDNENIMMYVPDVGNAAKIDLLSNIAKEFMDKSEREEARKEAEKLELLIQEIRQRRSEGEYNEEDNWLSFDDDEDYWDLKTNNKKDPNSKDPKKSKMDEIQSKIDEAKSRVDDSKFIFRYDLEHVFPYDGDKQIFEDMGDFIGIEGKTDELEFLINYDDTD